MKIITYYLPQFHEIPENDEWWGKGFTEWTNVKKAAPIFENHYQPRVPLENNYYNLLEDEIKKSQVNYAKKYGIYGFCFYHYWFEGKLLIEKPVEQFLNNKDLDIHFCLSWANESWMKTWVNSDTTVLVEQTYGTKQEWKKHFDYLLPFFKDERYILEDNKPFFILYRPWKIPQLNDMLRYWDSLARQEGFDGIKYVSQDYHENFNTKFDDSSFDYNIEYQPSLAHSFMERDYKYEKSYITNYFKNKRNRNSLPITKYKTKEKNKKIFNFFHKVHLKILGKLYPEFEVGLFDYQEVWDNILNKNPKNSKSIPGAFIGWDNTPRRDHNGGVDINFSLEKFEKNLSKQIQRTKNVYKKDMLFMNAWNEWGEGAYLEPDDKYGFGYLESVKNALIENNEFPEEK
ncbi:glycoside hydrolase family 99-like domain-containing protein [Lactococcus cremoris]|uniref:glycosyltransferase WbsX family protein n=1 Tax=Lactococcus lactis subsp. cremoris TaxID=1359 RepID=UPI002FC63F92